MCVLYVYQMGPVSIPSSLSLWHHGIQTVCVRLIIGVSKRVIDKVDYMYECRINSNQLGWLCSSRLFGLLAHCTLCKLITRHHSFNQVAFTVSLFCVCACVYPTAHEELKNMFSASFSSVPFIPFSLMLNAKCARLDDRFWHVSIYWYQDVNIHWLKKM